MLRFSMAKKVNGGSAPRRPMLVRFWRETRSDTAVEFALIGTVFFFFLFLILVISIVQYWQMTLDDSVRAAARQVSIGKIQSGGAFQTYVCNEFGITAANCGNNLQYDVASNNYFDDGTTGLAIPSASPDGSSLNSDGSLTNSGTFSLYSYSGPTGATTGSTLPNVKIEGHEVFLLVQVIYQLPFSIPLVGGAMTENGTSSLYSAVAAVMN